MKNLSLDAKIQVDIEDIKRHIQRKEDSEDYSHSEEKSNDSEFDEIVAQEQRKSKLRISLIERFRNMSMSRIKEYEILNEEKYKQFIELNEIPFGAFIN